jgi:predicted PhzF superfamily epimerase YddE/YHI9
VFVDGANALAIFTPTTELAFAGHPLVGAAWLLGQAELRVPAGVASARRLADRAWIVARASWSPQFERLQLGSPEDVDAFKVPVAGNLQVWAWLDEARGAIRARVFAPDLGVSEDPATGSAAIVLCAELGRPLVIEQGPGCVIEVQPLSDGLVELGGRVADDGDRSL